MKTIANRLIVIAAGTLALGTVAFGQTRTMTADIPFAFRTASGVMPAGTYQFERQSSRTGAESVIVRNTATEKAVFAGNSTTDYYKPAKGAPTVEFACAKDGCALKAIRTSEVSLEYAPSKPKHAEVAVISVPLKTLSTD